MEFIKTEDLENQIVHIVRNPNRPIMVYPKEILDKDLSLGAIGLWILLSIYEQQNRDISELIDIYDENSLNIYVEELQKANMVCYKD